jgi:hypothetical protein
MGEIRRFWKDHPVLTVTFGISSLFIMDRTLKAMKNDSGGFWGIGATTSTSTTTSSSHRTTPTDEEPTIPIPLQLHGTSANYVDNDDEVSINGLPGSMKRRIGHGKLSSGKDDYSPINPRTPDVTNANTVMGMYGSVDQMAGLGWM